jgi:hypothetical protein
MKELIAEWRKYINEQTAQQAPSQDVIASALGYLMTYVKDNPNKLSSIEPAINELVAYRTNPKSALSQKVSTIALNKARDTAQQDPELFNFWKGYGNMDVAKFLNSIRSKPSTQAQEQAKDQPASQPKVTEYRFKGRIDSPEIKVDDDGTVTATVTSPDAPGIVGVGKVSGMKNFGLARDAAISRAITDLARKAQQQ